MKKLLYILVAGLGLAMTACQNIPEDERLQPLDWNNVPRMRNVLLTEFTGLSCVNCPKAAEEAHNLQHACGDNLVVVAMHPESNSFTHTVNAAWDYTCHEADAYYKWLGGTSTTSFPAGAINFNASNGFVDYTQWMSVILKELMRPTTIGINIAATATDNRIDATLTLTATEATDAIVLLWLVENHVIGAQRMPDGEVNLSYEHNHMLRGELLSADGWGQAVHVAEQESVTLEGKDVSQLVNDIHNAILVAVALDPLTKQVLNVAEKQL